MSTRISRPKKATLAVLAGMVAAGPLIGQASAFAADEPPAADTNPSVTEASTRAITSVDNMLGKSFTFQAVHSGKNLDLTADDRVIQHNPNGGDNQEWTVFKNPMNTQGTGYVLRNVKSGKCLAPAFGTASAATTPCPTAKGGGVTTVWKIQLDPLGRVTFEASQGDPQAWHVLQVPNASKDDVQLTIGSRTGGDAERFIPKEMPVRHPKAESVPVGKTYTIQAQHSKKTLHENVAGKKVVQFTAKGGTNEQWTTVKGQYDGSTLLKNKQTGLCMTDNNDVLSTSTCNTSSPNQNWFVYSVGGNNYQIESANKEKIVDIPSNGTGDDVQAGLWKDNDGANQRFAFFNVDARDTMAALPDLYNKPVSITHNEKGHALDRVAGGSNANTAIPYMFQASDNQKWTIQSRANGSIWLKQGDRCLAYASTASITTPVCSDSDKTVEWNLADNGHGAFSIKAKNLSNQWLNVTPDGKSLNLQSAVDHWGWNIADMSSTAPDLMTTSLIDNYGWNGNGFGGKQFMVRNNTDQTLYVDQGVTDVDLKLPASLAPGEVATMLVHKGFFGGGNSHATFKTADGQVAYSVRWRGDDIYLSYPKSSGTQARPMYLAGSNGKYREWVAPDLPTGKEREFLNFPSGGIFLSIGSPDVVSKKPNRGGKCEAYGQMMNPADWTKLWGSQVNPDMARFIKAAVKAGMAWVPFPKSITDGETGAKLGAYIGSLIAGCDPFTDMNKFQFVNAWKDLVCDSPNAHIDCINGEKPKPNKPKASRSATGTGPLSVNSFGNDYTARPGNILGKDGQDRLKGKILRDGEPAPGVDVQFAVPADSGLYFKDTDGKHVTTVTATTGDNGEAVAQPLYAGDKEGDFTVTMTAVNEPGATEGEHPSGTYTVHVKK